MIFIGANKLANDVRRNSWKLIEYNFTGIIGIPRSGMLLATMLSEELHIGVCSYNEFLDNLGQEFVFYRHGKRPIEHPSTETYLVVDDSCYNGSCGNYVRALRDLFPNKKFISYVGYLEGPCRLYKPDLWMCDIRKEALNDPELPVALYYYNILDNYWNFKYLFDIDGVVCLDPPSDQNIELYEEYLNKPIPLHIPFTPSNNSLSFCTYRLEKYRSQTESFLRAQNLSIKDLYMYNAETISERNKVSSSTYKGLIYKNNNYKIFIESNDKEAQEICEISKKPVFCYETGRMYQINK